MNTRIDFTKLVNDNNGNPRYVCHFLSLNTESEKQSDLSISDKYKLAVKRANKIGGRKYHTKSYGGGIVFQSYNIVDTERQINELLNNNK